MCTDKSTQSDIRMHRIQKLIDDIPTVVNIGLRGPQRALTMAERVLSLMEDQDISTPVNRGPIHYDAFQVAQAANDRSKVLKHLRRAYQCAIFSDGPDSPLVQKYKRLMEEHNI